MGKPSEFDPNSQGSGKAWLLDGCPKVGERNLDQEVDEYKTAPVRCCSHSKASCYSKEIGCIKQTYFDAPHVCQARHAPVHLSRDEDKSLLWNWLQFRS